MSEPPPATEAVNVAWRAAVEAASQVLEDRLGRTVSNLDRQAIAFAIGQAVVAKLSAASKRCWTGTLDAACWVCDRDHHEHLGLELLCPPA